MKYIKLFNESFKNSTYGDSIKKRFREPTYPEKPFQRDLTSDEKSKMRKHFSNHSWSQVDNKGRIILGGGEEARGLFYINVEDLGKLS
jgi:hypothetical protein